MRLFVAADVPGGLKDRIESEVTGPLRAQLPAARWTRPEGRHLTVKFLGEVSPERVPAIEEALRAAAARHEGFEAAFTHIGGFPTLGRPRVLWVGLGPGAEALRGLADDVERELEGCGFERERRAFHAHLTLARFKRPQPIDELPPIEVPSSTFPMEELTLFQSQLHPKGARYTAVERFPLGARG